MTQLEDLFGQLPEELTGDDRRTLTADLFEGLPAVIESQRLKITAHPLGHAYGDSARYDKVDFFADKPTYRRLGLVLLSTLFFPNRTITIHLTHAKTGVKFIRAECCIEGWSLASKANGLIMVPAAYGYEPAPIFHLHPLWREDWRIENCDARAGRASSDLPFFDLTNESAGCSSPEEFANRTYLDGFGSPHATATLAALLLNIGLPKTEQKEICLESPSGNWSVAIGSAEAKFYVHSESDPDCTDPWEFWT